MEKEELSPGIRLSPGFSEKLPRKNAQESEGSPCWTPENWSPPLMSPPLVTDNCPPTSIPHPYTLQGIFQHFFRRKTRKKQQIQMEYSTVPLAAAGEDRSADRDLTLPAQRRG